VASRTKDFKPYLIARRGERNVPKRYLKRAYWSDIGDAGYWVKHNSDYYIVEFNFDFHVWTNARYSAPQSAWEITGIVPTEVGLDISDEEVVPRSDYGPIDGQPDPESDQSKKGFFDTDDEEESLAPEDIEIKPTDKEDNQEEQIANLAQNIPTVLTQ